MTRSALKKQQCESILHAIILPPLQTRSAPVDSTSESCEEHAHPSIYQCPALSPRSAPNCGLLICSNDHFHTRPSIVATLAPYSIPFHVIVEQTDVRTVRAIPSVEVCLDMDGCATWQYQHRTSTASSSTQMVISPTQYHYHSHPRFLVDDRIGFRTFARCCQMHDHEWPSAKTEAIHPSPSNGIHTYS